MKRYKIGYTQGVYDMFHVGHLNLINNAKQYCEYLIVGINTDALVQEYKHKQPVINQEERRYIVENVRAVDEVVIVETLDKVAMWNKLHFDAVFIGDDWKGNPRWEATKVELEKYGVDVVFLPHTEGVSSTMLRDEKEQVVGE
ncbi:MAG: adenylyltransferase/cytidyltransferase family protein [Lachnospiraceae bacterium]|jgi:glycerol-3-phosphate cytidylyltransferase|nr:adenylyltransferase/cytidyltransferase family protein [uncultured Acetatifactor sp.]MCI9219657.1 adenylyltransferase/cytidyltransferase family protein [Lachnospiraceae bacterium]